MKLIKFNIMNRNYFILLIAIIFLQFLTGNLKAQTGIDFETGVAFTGYNNVRIPGNTGTLFSLNRDLNAHEKIFYRIRLNQTLGKRHDISVLFAPLTIKSSGSFDESVNFEGVIFQPGADISAEYKFNSYRLTYRYDFIKNDALELGIGFTAKIRDAKIALISGQNESIKTNVGFVPIINLRMLWNIRDNFGLLVYGDALAAPQGRAEDFLVALQYRLSDKISIKGGYRILEGGADNDEVYNFSLINYGVVGVTFRL